MYVCFFLCVCTKSHITTELMPLSSSFNFNSRFETFGYILFLFLSNILYFFSLYQSMFLLEILLIVCNLQFAIQMNYFHYYFLIIFFHFIFLLQKDSFFVNNNNSNFSLKIAIVAKQNGFICCSSVFLWAQHAKTRFSKHGHFNKNFNLVLNMI